MRGPGERPRAQLKTRAQPRGEAPRARGGGEGEGRGAGARARLEQRLGLTPLPVDGDLADKAGPLGMGRVRTSVWEADKLRKVVLSHISMAPVIEGLALVLLPVQELDFPIFAADLMALPTRISVNADTYGADWQTRKSLEPVRTAFRRLGASPGPTWAARLGSGRGLHARLSPRQASDGFAALTQGLGAYLDELADAPPGRSVNQQRAFFQAFHDNGPRKGPLSRVMGESWAERYSRLVFE